MNVEDVIGEPGLIELTRLNVIIGVIYRPPNDISLIP